MNVSLNHSRIDDEKGDFVILTDYGSEGISVSEQHDSLEDAVRSFGKFEGQVLVKLVRIPVKEGSEQEAANDE